jgi:starch-binding outer membrane protein, SusD/RagB family
MKSKNKLTYILFFSLLILFGCKKFIAVEAPVNTVNEDNVYQTDANAIAVLSGIYVNLSLEDSKLGSAGNGPTLLNFLPGLSADELTLSGSNRQDFIAYYKNALSTQAVGDVGFWSRTYFYIYSSNAAIIGLTKSQSLSPSVKNQLLGEAYFIRAFCYFYLVNLYGDVPIETSVDYKINAVLHRSKVSEVYAMIKSDLIKAQSLLNENFLDYTLLKTSSERIRPNKGAATALLARTYLYLKEWSNAENESSKLIENNSLYSLDDLANVFLKNSQETIWALQPVGTGQASNTGSGRLYVLSNAGVNGGTYPVYLSNLLLEKFEDNDPRLATWTSFVTVAGVQYYFANKYKVGNVAAPTTEYPIVFRLAEQYLIRAESRAMQNNISGAIDDLNIIRERARGSQADTILPDLPSTLNQEQTENAILHERQIELFTEWGHRWLDIKRNDTVNSVMSVITQLKGGIWKSSQALYPIPSSEIVKNPNLIQNPEY